MCQQFAQDLELKNSSVTGTGQSDLLREAGSYVSSDLFCFISIISKSSIFAQESTSLF